MNKVNTFQKKRDSNEIFVTFEKENRITRQKSHQQIHPLSIFGCAQFFWLLLLLLFFFFINIDVVVGSSLKNI